MSSKPCETTLQDADAESKYYINIFYSLDGNNKRRVYSLFPWGISAHPKATKHGQKKSAAARSHVSV